MRSFLRRLVGKIIVAISLTLVVVVVGFAIYLASLTGSLPWQSNPTRIAITPFANIPGFNAPIVTATATAAAAMGTPAGS